ncbi:MAG: WD40/YVTN/BNR-like repeat-containing protein [Terriglobales bacterium]
MRRLLACLIAIATILPAAAQTKSAPAKPKDKPKVETPAKVEEAKPAEAAADKTGDSKSEEGAEGRRPKDPMSAPTFNGIHLRLVGPAVISGRVVAFAVNPKNRAEYYAAAASGGVWKTINAGTTWTPVFDGEGSYSIGTIVLDPKNASIVWVGTGENNAQRSVAWGDGVYKSEDGGHSWKNMGLKKSEHIGRIAIDPRDSRTVYVAAQGPLWSSGGDRGLFKTTDGGKTWKNVLPNVSDNTGVTDVVIDPDNPDTIYAATWQRRRHVFTYISGGPESAIYKSNDAGETWTKLKSGLPTDDLGRIGLTIAPGDSSMLYATVEAANGHSGIFRSTDHGATWERRSSNIAQAMYYAQLSVDPKNSDRVYMPNVVFQVSDDGGKTFHNLGERNKHVDNHVIWVDPNDTNFYLVGCDGGIYDSYDRGATWNFKGNLPLGQFYDVTYDYAKPFYFVYGGTQDNSSWGGPSRNRSASGIVNSDWFQTHGGDGFRSQVDPQDPNTIYAELQYGDIVRFDRRSGEAVGIQPQEGTSDPANRWNWDSPVIISPHSHTRLYFASQRLYRSDDRGDTWKPISGDLTRQIDRNKLPVMGKIWSADAIGKNASTSFYGNIVALAESPKKEGLVYVGTDDGLIQVTEDNGAHWTKYEKFPGVPENTYVSRIVTSPANADLVYAAFDNHKNGDYKPYLLRSTDAGKTWSSIAANLPETGPVLAFAEDTVNDKVLFAGTEYGLWFSIDSGKKWIQLKGNFPTIAVRDLAVHPREGDLIVATFGRGIYILDDLTPLRLLSDRTLAEQAVTFPVKDTLMYIQTRPIGGRGKAFQGESYYTADNPAYGATFTYYLKDKLKSLKEKRQDRERQLARQNQPIPYPTAEEFRAEAEEEAPQVFAVVYDSNNQPVRRLEAMNAPGFHRIAWELRYSSPTLPPERRPDQEEELFSRQSGGPLVMPGKYSIKLFTKAGGTVAEVGQPEVFNVFADTDSPVRPEDRLALQEFQQKVAKLYRALSGSINTANETRTQLRAIKRALNETPTADSSLAKSADQLDLQLAEFLRVVQGDRVLAEHNEPVPPSINERVQNIMSGERLAIQRPTQTHIENYNIAAEEFGTELAKLRKVVEVDLKDLSGKLDQAGAPWTPGRVPEWKP